VKGFSKKSITAIGEVCYPEALSKTEISANALDLWLSLPWADLILRPDLSGLRMTKSEGLRASHSNRLVVAERR
jgi:hypothetical protein